MNLKKIIALFIVILSLSCSDDEKAIDIVLEQVERGAVLRNIDRISPNFEHNNFQSVFAVELEEQDIEEGGIFDFVRLHIAYADRTPENGINSVSEQVLRDVPSTDFQIGPDALPRGIIQVSYQEAIDALNLNQNSILPGDQFDLRMELTLTDGRTFSTENGSASILTDFCFFKSPYRYVVNVIEPIADDLFTGSYNYEIISSDSNPNFGIAEQGVVFIRVGNTPNVRLTGIVAEGLEFTVAGTNVHPKIYQSFNLFCRESALHILTGPDEQNFGQVNDIDDTAFDLDLVVGYEGWGGTGDFDAPTRYKIRFSKQ